MATKKNPAAVALGRKGGLIGGRARAAKMTPEERSESARRAVVARWTKKRAYRDPTIMATEEGLREVRNSPIEAITRSGRKRRPAS